VRGGDLLSVGIPEKVRDRITARGDASQLQNGAGVTRSSGSFSERGARNRCGTPGVTSVEALMRTAVWKHSKTLSAESIKALVDEGTRLVVQYLKFA
jgi:hypothetical protein